MILGDSLQVMASLAENESLRGKVQMIYFDPPYGIKFNSNWQPSTKSTNVKDGSRDAITREPEMVKAFRDTWHDGIHSYLGYLRDRFTVARDLLSESGSCFVQIGDANVHKVRALLDEVFGEENFVSQITVRTTTGRASNMLAAASNFILWYAKDKEECKYRSLYQGKENGLSTDQVFKRVRLGNGEEIPLASFKGSFDDNARLFSPGDLTSARHANGGDVMEYWFHGQKFTPGTRTFRTSKEGLDRLVKADRIFRTTKTSIRYINYYNDFPQMPFSNMWTDTGTGSFTDDKIYVCQTGVKTIERCLLMTTDPGDLVLDPTCGSGTTAYVAEQWGRRWITIDTSRVALALARTRLMTAKYPYYLLADSEAGVKKEMEVTGKAIVRETYGRVSQGFVYERVPHITLKAIANDAEIDIIWDEYAAESERLRRQLPQSASPTAPSRGGQSELDSAPSVRGLPPKAGGGVLRADAADSKDIPEEWEIPAEAPADWTPEQKAAHAAFMELKRKRQREIDESIARVAETEYLYDRPYEDKKRVRVAGPFTIESVAPTRSLIVNADGTATDPVAKIAKDIDYGNGENYVSRMIGILRKAGVKQSKKADRIVFSSVTPFAAGRHIAAEGWTEAGENGKPKHFAIAFGPEFGSVTRLDMKAATREALEAGFDVLLYCAFNFEAYVEEGSDNAFGRLKVIHARMNSDLHMATDLKETGGGNPFIVFGEPDIDIRRTEDDELVVEIRGVDVYDPKNDEVRSDNADDIDCWMLDTDYNEEAFFARHVYFPGRDRIYDAFRKFLNNDIDREEWESVAKTVSRPFPRPKTGRIAVKVINHFGDEVMKVFEV
jgi:adenine-specific DNA-methyltransferase